LKSSRRRTRAEAGPTAVELRAKVRRIALILERSLGTPRQAAELPPPLDMLIATILSQNTNDKNSHRAYTELRNRFPGWSDVAAAPLRSVIRAIRPGGMANQKGRRIKEVLKTIRARHGTYSLRRLGDKSDREIIDELTAMGGVGVKTAACVLLFSLGRDCFPVDTHVHRLCTRLGCAPGSTTPERTFELMRDLVPRGRAYSLHTNLIRFGRKVCRSSSPFCSVCPVYDECSYEGKRAGRERRRPAPSAADHDFMLLDNVRRP
jgi:endonuclease-3